MSPTSYQTAPPRSNDGTLASRPPQVKMTGLARGRTAPATRDCFRRCVGPAVPLSSRALTGRRYRTHPVSYLEEVGLKVLRRAAWLALAGISLVGPGQAFAAAEIHRLNLVLSSNPTSLRADDLNEFLTDFNTRYLQPKGLEPLEQFSFTFLNEAELRYFVRPNVSVTAGFGQIRATSKREYLPRLAQRIELRTEVVAVPLQVGATYYLAPYNQGDFQARAFVGGGLVTVTQGKVMFEQLEFATDSATTLNPSGKPGSTRYK